MEPIVTTAPAVVPPPPESLEEAGLSEDLVAGLIVKALYHQGSSGGFELSELLALPYSVLDDVIEQLQEQRVLQVHATRGPTRGEYVFALTGEGRKRAAEELELSRYVGPAPVPLDDFRRWVELQTIQGTRVSATELQRALEGVVVPDAMLDVLGPAVNSGRSLFLYGDSGNGKTLLAKRLSRLFGERYFVPYSVLVDGSIMIVHDPVYHGGEHPERGTTQRFDRDASERGTVRSTHHAAAWNDDSDLSDSGEPAAAPNAWAPAAASTDPGNGATPLNGRESGDMLQALLRTVSLHDRRFAEARRPVVITGGELTLDQLELQWDSGGRMYQAPPQLKAAGGVLVIDDLGRQKVEVRELLNRWGVPLEQRQDHLTLRNGRKLVVPFDCFVIFSTNLEPRSLADDAFMRRIHYKIEVPDPDRGEYERIFVSCCEEQGVPFDKRAVDFIFDEFYRRGAIAPRRCHPRDVLDHVRDLAEYRCEPVSLAPSLLEPACRSYFLPSS